LDVSDPVLVKILSAHPHLGESDYRALETWWLLDRQPGEDVVHFLVRQGVFVQEAQRTIDMLRRGMLTYADPRRLFGETGHQRLRQYAQLAGFTDTRPVSPQPVTPSPIAPPMPTPAPVDRLAQVRDWLARRAEAKQPAAAPPMVPLLSPTPKGPVTPSPFSSLSVPKDPPSMPPQADPANALDRARFPEVGDQYGKYFITEQLGRGAAAVVFRAFHRTLNSTVALKVLKIQRDAPETQDPSGLLEGLRREAQLLARFNHPNLVRVFDYIEETSYPFLVLEYVEGLNLHDVLSHSGRLRLDRAVKMVTAVADGLAAAQRRTGLVHRDVKPGNILLSRDGGVKLADLGLAIIEESQRTLKPSNVHGPNSGIVGTAAYMSPEQCNGEPVDHRSDIYSLGATFYHMIVGDMPFQGKNRVEVMIKQVTERPVPPHHLVPGLDPVVSDVILHMMRKDPNERYQTYDDLLNDLQLLHTGSFTEIQLPPADYTG
jgi:serine/threonine protein kinase